MKKIILSFILLCACTIYLHSQEGKMYTFTFENQPLKTVLLEIESNSNYQFFFIDDWLDNITINKSYSELPIRIILDDLLQQTVINYYVLDEGKIILSNNSAIDDRFNDELLNENIAPITDSISSKITIPTTETIITNVDSISKPKVITQTAKPIIKNPVKQQVNRIVSSTTINVGKENINDSRKTFTLQGYVKDLNSNKPLENIVIKIKGKPIGTTSDKNGFYSLKLPKGKYTITTRSLNSIDFEQNINLYNDGSLDLDLIEKTESLSEVVIKADIDKNVREVITGVTKIEVEEIKNIPLVLGERDILKVATTLPGITTTGEGSNGYNVRGGKTDQNLILLDNASIYNPSHFFGIFSAINPFTTSSADIYKGHIPAEYGGRLSSVFKINSKNARTDKIGGEVSVGPVTANVALELPIVKEKSGLIIGGRSTYSGWILRSLDEESLNNSEASFFDVIAKYNHNIDENNTVSATAYYSKDRFSITSDSLYGYSNQSASIGWKHRYSEKHKSDITLTNSAYDFTIEFDGDFNRDFDLAYRNSETELKLKFNYDYNEKFDFTYGIASKLYTIEPGKLKPLNSNSDIVPLTIEKERGLESAAFISSNIELNKKLAIDVGLRYSFYAFLGEATQRRYQPNQPKNESTLIATETFGKNEFIKTFGGLEGRISARYFLLEDFSVKASLNNSYQYIHTLSNNTTVSPFDTWKLSDLNVKPQQAQQATLGLFKNFDDVMYEVSVEGYYKTYDNILDYKVGAQLLLNESLETQVLQGEGRSYGIEFLIKKNRGRFNGWLGYTYSRTELKLDSQFAEERVNNGNYFPANYDKPHDFSGVINYKMTQRFSFSGNFVYQTGRPITYPVGTYIFNNAEFTLYSDRNKFRIPDYYRLDVGFNYEGNHKKNKIAQGFWNLSIYNVLGRNNPYSVFFVTEDGQIKALQSSIFSIPVPTITYNFKF